MSSIMSRRMAVRVFGVAIACVFAITLGLDAAHAQGGRTRIKFKLHAAAKANNPKGKAKYEERASGRKKLTVEVEHILNTTNIDVFVDGNSVGTAALVAGTVQIELDTENADTVPTMTEASVVEVFDADTDVKLLTNQ